MRRRGKQTRLQDSLERLVRSLDRRSPGRLLQVRIAEAWTNVAGPVVAGHTASAHLRGSELVVLVDSPTWAAELTALAGPYRDAMNRELGQRTVQSVRFVVSRELARQAQRRSALPDPSIERPEGEEGVSIPLSAEERAAVQRWAAMIEDERLRELAVRVTVAGMERERALRAAGAGREAPAESGERPV